MNYYKKFISCEDGVETLEFLSADDNTMNDDSTTSGKQSFIENRSKKGELEPGYIIILLFAGLLLAVIIIMAIRGRGDRAVLEKEQSAKSAVREYKKKNL